MPRRLYLAAHVTHVQAPMTGTAFLPPPLALVRHPTQLRVCHRRVPQLNARGRVVAIASPRTEEWDCVVVGSGFGGLCCAAVLTAYGFRTLCLESHYAAGGVAHGFDCENDAGVFRFDTGPSFYCGLSTTGSLNPVKHALDAVGEHVKCVSYDRFCIDDLREGTVEVCEDESVTLRGVEAIAGADAARQLEAFYAAMRAMHRPMDVPAIALRGDWRVGPVIVRRWAKSMLALLPFVADIQRPVSRVMKRVGVKDVFVKRLLDTEAFLLSGLKTDATITAEIAFMVGERAKPGSIEYPVGGARAIIDALVRGIERNGGEVRLREHVSGITVHDGVAVGVELRGKGKSPILAKKGVFSNASVWDTVKHLIPASALPAAYRVSALRTPAVESFMHVHVAIPSDGLEEFVGHHAVIIDSTIDIAKPGNTVMISVPTVWSPDMAPPGYHIIHAYTLEPYERWPALSKNRAAYEVAKKAAGAPLLAAIRHVIPDLDSRLRHPNAILQFGSPMTHARFCRRYQGTYGPAIDADGTEKFEWPGDIPIASLKRCGDTCFPGIGVPAAAASGIIAANEMVSVAENNDLVDRVFPRVRSEM